MFHLRRNVRFHDGAPFSADDVVFSFARVRKPGSNMLSRVAEIAEQGFAASACVVHELEEAGL